MSSLKILVVGWDKLRAVPAKTRLSVAGTARSLFQPTCCATQPFWLGHP
jgi:hypothetical protein